MKKYERFPVLRPIYSLRLFSSLFLFVLFLVFSAGAVSHLSGNPLDPITIEDDSYDIGAHPWEIITADFDGDGHEDLATNISVGDEVAVLLGNGDGTFQSAVYYWAGYRPMTVVSEDFNEDGIADLAVASVDSNLIVVRMGSGDGTFGDSLVFGTGNFPSNLITGDINRDGHTDLLASTSYTNDVSVHLGDGEGGFEDPIFSVIDGGPRSPELGDFNEDGNLDLAVSLRSAIDLLGIMFGDGTGSFDSTISFRVGDYPKESVVRDFNGDGHHDVAVACRIESAVKIVYGDGSGSFSQPESLAVGEGPRYLISDDVDEDGIADLLSTNFYGNNLSILVGNGEGGFPLRRDFNIGTGPRGLTTGDFDEDGDPDLALVIFGEDRISIALDIKDDLTPLLISPADSAVLSADPTFVWKEVSGANAHQLVLYNDQDQLIWSAFFQDISSVSYDGSTLLDPGATYRWSVREREQNVWKENAPFYSFQKTQPGTILPAPSLNLPSNGENIALPELFSWIALDSASRYEFSVYDDSAAVTLLYRTLTEEHSVYVPSGLTGMTDLKAYYWQVRGVDAEGYAGEYSETGQFLLTDLVTPPETPVLVFPSSADTVDQSTVTFIWQPSLDAMSYSLEFSLDSLFTLSSDETWSFERITDSLHTVQLREGSSTIYWRVRAFNNAGASSWSAPDQFEYEGGMVATISFVEILDPETGSEIELGKSILPIGRIGGSYSGTVRGEWFLNGSVLDSFSVEMISSEGVEVQGPVIHVATLGSDTLILGVTSPDSVSTAPTVYDVVVPTSGEVTGIHLVASPFAIPADSQSQSTITAFMVDNEGRRVYTDYARLIGFAVVGEGYAVGPSSALTDSGVARLVLSSTKTPDSDVLVFAYSTGITGDYTYVMTYDEELDAFVSRLLAHIDRLENLPLDYYPDRFDTTSDGYDLSGVWDFLNQQILGVPDPPLESVESLKRMTLALRYLDMCYFYRHSPLFPEEDTRPLYGAGPIFDYISGPVSEAAITAAYFTSITDGVLQQSGSFSVARKIAHSTYRNAQRLFDGLYPATVEQTNDVSMQSLILRAMYDSHSEAASLSRLDEDPLSLFDDFTLRFDRQFEFLNLYVQDTQYLIDSVASWAQTHTYSLTYEESYEQANKLLEEVRALTNSAYIEADEFDLDNKFRESSEEISLLQESITQGLEVPRLVSDLRETVGYISYPDRWAGAGELVPIAVNSFNQLQTDQIPDGVWQSFGLNRGVGAPGHGPATFLFEPEDRKRVESLLLLFAERGIEFETITNHIRAALSENDSAVVADNLDELSEAGDELLDLLYLLRGTFGSFTVDARGGIAGFEKIYEDMNEAYFTVTRGISTFELSLLDYLFNRSFAYAQTGADQSGYDALTRVNETVKQYTEILPSFFDLPARSVLVPVALSFPDSVGPSRIFRVNANLVNAGAGEATDVSCVFLFEGPFELLSSDTILVSTLAPGDSVGLSWQLKVKQPGHPDLKRGLYSSSINVSSSGAVGYPRFLFLKTFEKSFGVNKSLEKRGPLQDIRLHSLPRSYCLYQNSPNPFNPSTSIRYDIPEGEPVKVRLSIFDVRGRLLITLVNKIREPGRYTVHWDGRDKTGRKLGTGMYFYVIDSGSFRSTRKMLLWK